ncbi:MAG: hypothetical protein RR893_06665 [Clostridia bacterium]
MTAEPSAGSLPGLFPTARESATARGDISPTAAQPAQFLPALSPTERESLKYLGYGASAPDERTLALIRQVLQAARAQTRFRCVTRVMDAQVAQDRVTLDGGYTLFSRDLARHLAGCTRVQLIGATLGPGADTLLRRYQACDLAGAACAQAALAALLEEALEARSCEGLTARFSPGYGDLALDAQPIFFDLLDLPRHLGLSLTSGGMMLPSKSVTAITGLRANAARATHDCAHCESRDCPYRVSP